MNHGQELEVVRRRVGVALNDLWVDYLGLGGVETPRTVEAYLRGEDSLDEGQHDVLAQAINERAIDKGMHYPAPYARK